MRVLDIGTGQAGALAAMLLADMGAEVVRFDLGGAPPADGRDAIWNRWKRRVAIADEPQLSQAIQAELPKADIIITDMGKAARARVGLDTGSLTAASSGLIIAIIRGWPEGHAKEDRPVDDALVLAEAGFFDEQLPMRRDGPMYLRLPLGSVHAAYLAVVGILARLWAKRRDGRGGIVRTSLLQGALVPQLMHWQRAEFPTDSVKFGMPKYITLIGQYESGDGLWFHMIGLPQQAPTFAAAFEATSAEERAALNAPYEQSSRHFPPDFGVVETIFKTRPRQFWLEELWANDIPVQPVLPMGALYDDEQVRANGYAIAVDDPRLGRTVQPASPITMTPLAAGEAAFGTGSKLEGVMPGAPPLAGLRVLDFGSILAGPLSPMILADLGADVIKVEQPSGDTARKTVEWAFNACQRGKRAISLQLKSPEVKPIVEALVRSADVVHHNMRMPAAQRLGIDYDSLRAINPKIVYTHVSSYGPEGPRRNWPGFDQLFQAASGWELAGAGEGNPPTWHRFGMMDHLCALASTAGTLLALLRSADRGEGQFVAASLLAASLMTSETVQRADGSLTPWAPLDADQMGISAVRRIYRTADAWVTIAAPETDVAAEKRLLAKAGAADVIALERRFLGLSSDGALLLARSADIPAVRVALSNRDAFFDDPENRRTRLSIEHQHPTLGRFEQPGALLDFADLPTVFNRPPPTLGQHTREVLAEVGFRESDIDALIAAGVAA